MRRTITIAGGGLAGLTLGLLLRREGAPVEIWDAGSYPRQRVCGEFINGKGIDVLAQLGVRDFPTPFGSPAGSVRFFNAGRSSGVLALPRPALSVDRAKLDHLLATEFKRRGGILHENSRWTGSFEGEGMVRATGRRLERGDRPKFVGLKVHARDLPLSADLELHFSNEGYVGFSRQQDGTVNVCGLFRAELELPEARTNSRKILSRMVSGPLKERLEKAACDDFAAVAGISLKRERAGATAECRIGDSICMIPPLTGNGMSLAVESAACAAPFLAGYSGGRLEWDEARRAIARSCDQRFVRRLTFAGFFQALAFRSGGRAAMMSILRTTPRVLDAWFWLAR